MYRKISACCNCIHQMLARFISGCGIWGVINISILTCPSFWVFICWLCIVLTMVETPWREMAGCAGPGMGLLPWACPLDCLGPLSAKDSTSASFLESSVLLRFDFLWTHPVSIFDPNFPLVNSWPSYSGSVGFPGLPLPLFFPFLLVYERTWNHLQISPFKKHLLTFTAARPWEVGMERWVIYTCPLSMSYWRKQVGGQRCQKSGLCILG